MIYSTLDVSLLLDGVDGSTVKNVAPEPIEIHCDDPSKLFFTISSDDAVQFTIYSVDPKTQKSKTLRTITTKKAAGQKKYTANAAGLLLEAGNYFVTVKLTGRSNNSGYTLGLDRWQSIFYDQADDGWNNFLYNSKTKTVNPDVFYDGGVTIDEFTDVVDLDGATPGFVGFGDAADYRKIELESAAKLSFTVSSTDAVKFTVYSLTESLDKKGNTVYTQKALQTSTAKLNKATGKYEVTTAGLLLDNANANTAYFLAVESTNAAKGGYAEYSVGVNRNSRFYNLGDGSTATSGNGWLYNAKTKNPNPDVFNGPATWIDEDTGAVAVDQTAQGFVGFGDAADYRQFTLGSAAKLSFDVEATDAVKFTVYSLTESWDKKGNIVYTQKALQTSTAKLDKATGSYKVTTAALLIDNTDPNISYYLAVESTNAAKGGYAEYSVRVNGESRFYNKGFNDDDTWMGAEELFGSGFIADSDEETSMTGGWVGFGDAVDFKSFTVERDMSVCFNVDASGPVKFTVYRLTNGKLTSLQSTTVKANVGTTTKALALKAGESYFVAVESTDAAKGGYADYTVTGSRYAAPLNVTTNGQGLPWDGWFILEDNWDKEKARIETPVGTAGADKITFAGNRMIHVPGTLAMKGGNDIVTISASAYHGGIPGNNGGAVLFDAIEMGDGNDKLVCGAYTGVWWTAIDMGNGDDTFQLAANGTAFGGQRFVTGGTLTLNFGAGNDLLELGSNSALCAWGDDGSRVDFGSGNDTMKMAADAFFSASSLNFGEGNDTLTIAKGAGIMEVALLDFGAGNDTMTVDKGNDRFSAIYDTLDFGDGYDTLVLNGRLNVGKKITGVEKVSGKGFVFLTGENDDYQAGDYAAFTDAGITVVQGFAKDDAYYGVNSSFYEYCYFSDPQSELADNVMSKARNLETESESKYANFWLCGEETAEGLAYGFTDETDFIKLAVDRSMQSKTLSCACYGGSGFSLELLNAAGNAAVRKSDRTSIVLYSGDSLDLADIAAGTYYMKLSVASDGYAAGEVWIIPTELFCLTA